MRSSPCSVSHLSSVIYIVINSSPQGHELGHWYYCECFFFNMPSTVSYSSTAHPTKLLFGTQIHLFLTLLVFSVFINNQSLYAAFGFNPELAIAAPQPFCIGFVLFQLVWEPTDAFVKFLMHAQTRKYEYQAGEILHGCPPDGKLMLL